MKIWQSVWGDDCSDSKPGGTTGGGGDPPKPGEARPLVGDAGGTNKGRDPTPTKQA